MIRTSKSNLPLVSIVIPIFNVEKYISQCLNSAISQTYKNIEILCIDDNGEDESMKIVSSLSKTGSRIKIIHHKNNLGLGQLETLVFARLEVNIFIFLTQMTGLNQTKLKI